MSGILSALADSVIEILVILLIAGFTAVAPKIASYLSTLKQKDNLHIIDMLTDRAVELVEAEIGGAAGSTKLELATQYASKFLAEHGIQVSPARLRADIENGVNKLKATQANQAEISPFEVMIPATGPEVQNVNDTPPSPAL